MDRDEVEVSGMYPPIFGLHMVDPALGQAVIRIYNDWTAEFARSAPERCRLPAQLVPDDHPEGSRDEMLRVSAMSIRRVNFLVGTVTTAMYQPAWDAFWDTAEAHNVSVHFHVGGPNHSGASAVRQAPEADERKPAFGIGLGDGATLRLVLAESGTGRIPFTVQEMDYRYHQVLDREAPDDFALTKPPNEVFKKQVWATYQQDLVGLHLIPFFGEGQMMWASDYPHPDSTWPHSRAVLNREMAHLDLEMRQKITCENAKAFYQL
jgi:predicted TIM-barrel fold metal-dependent hydrolase